MAWIDRSGLLNRDTEDLGIISSSKTKMEYAYYCSSFKCAGSKNEVLKFKSTDWEVECEDCKGLLHSKRLKSKSY